MAELVAIAKNEAMKSYYKEIEQWEKEAEEARKITSNSAQLKREKETLQEQIAKKQTEIDEKVKEWYSVNNEKLITDPSNYSCQYCGAEYSPEKIITIQSEVSEKFKKAKADKLEAITQQGQALEKEKNSLKARLDEVEKSIQSLPAAPENTRPRPVQPEFVYTPDNQYIGIQSEIESLSANEEGAIDTTEQNILKNQLDETIKEIKDLNKTLQDKELITKYKARIKELEEQERAINQELSNHEGEDQLLTEYSKLMMEAVENAVASKFEFVKFKLFNKQINGGEAPTCQAMVNGVPFQSLNNAMRINAGLDIIRALQNHIGIAAPIFIDNRESVTEISLMNCQIINLVVNKEYKSLNIS